MIRFLTAGESHGQKLTAILEGMPAGLPLDVQVINRELTRRQKGAGAGQRMKIENDTITITSGIIQNQTTGSPIALEIENKDFVNWHKKSLQPITIPRPGHADLTGAVKYGYQDFRIPAERSSARETAVRVAVGAICQTLLQQFKISIIGYVTQIGKIKYFPEPLPNLVGESANPSILERAQYAEESEVRCPDMQISEDMIQAITKAGENGDSLGGVIEAIADGVPPGLGSFVHYDRRLDSKLASAIMSIPAVKGFSIGNVFQNVHKFGSEINDPLYVTKQGELFRTTNYSGGIEGGISNGEPIIVNVAVKAIPTFPKGIPSVDIATGKSSTSPFQRSDCCPVPRAVPVVTAMFAIVLADLLIEKLGGDSLGEMQKRFQTLRKMNINDFQMQKEEWLFI